jgi:hypothetical protein
MVSDENPFAPPRSADLVVGVKSGRREDRKTVAVAQKSILICILLYFICVGVQLVLARNPASFQYSVYLAIVGLAVVLAATVSVFLLAIRVYSVASGILLGIGTLVPCLGLFILLIINGKATKILKDNGHHVGLLGADLSRF